MISNIVLMNCSIMTTEGYYKKQKASLVEVKKAVEKHPNFISAIGHNATAEILSELLGVKVPVNRIKYEHNFSDVCFIFQLRDRIPEGKILTKDEIEKIGYDFFSVYMLSDRATNHRRF